MPESDSGVLAQVLDPRRLARVRESGLLDTPPEEAFDRLTRLAAKLTGAPVTFISIVDESRDFYKSCYGFPEPLASERQLKGTTFCHYAIESMDPLVIEDTLAHPVYREVPTVKSLGIRAYLGIPMAMTGGEVIGSFCAIDFQPRAWRQMDVEVMQELAASTMREIELRAAIESERSAQQLLTAERRMLETTLRQLPTGVMVASANGRIVLSNARARQILGREIEEIDETRPGVERWPLTRAIRHGETVAGEEIIFTHPDGGRRVIKVSAAPIEDGHRLGGVITITDITAARTASDERETLLKELDEERRRLRVLIENIPSGVIFAEAPSGKIVLANHRIEEILGHPPHASESVDEYDQWRAVHGDGRFVQPREWPLARALQGETVRGFEALYLKPDGSKTWIRVQGAPVRDADGNVIGGIVALYDIDQERRMALENERLYEEARSANKAKDEFFAAVTHELRTPMTAIIGWSRLLKLETQASPEATEAVDMIESSARVQARLVDDLLDISRIAAGKIELRRERIHVHGVIDEAIRAAEPAAASKGVRLRFHVQQDVEVEADRSRVRQIFGNLLSNAIKFTPEGGLVEIVCHGPQGTHIELEVRDTGRGISPELLPHIFERGRQERDAEQGGLGLGLTIVRHLIELHGGSIRATSEGLGKGATFIIRLPIAS